MSHCCGPLERFQNIHWDQYQKPAYEGQIASGVLFAATAVVLTVLVALHPQGSYIAANYALFASLGGACIVSFLIFAVCSCINYASIRRIRMDNANRIQMNELKSTEETSLPIQTDVKISVEEKPLEYIKEVLLHPLLREFKGAVKGAVFADSVKTSKPIGNKAQEIEEAFKECEELFDAFLGNPRLFVIELLRYFGPGKKTAWSALLRVISAHNSGDTQKLEDVKKEYDAIMRGNDFTKIAHALRTQTNDRLMELLPALVEKLFSLPDANLQVLGRQILDHIFSATRNNPKILSALDSLKQKAQHSDEIALEVEAFVKIVHEEAHVSAEKYKEWNDTLIQHMLSTTFKRTVCIFLGMIARNIRILRFMFDKHADKEKLFIDIDETFLISVSSDCMKREALQKDIFRLQSVFNFNRKEDKKIAFIALPEDENRDYEVLCQEGVIKLCYKAHKGNLKELREISQSDAVKTLGRKHGFRLIAVPVSILDHPFKTFKNREGLIKSVAFVAIKLLGEFLPEIVKPKLMQIMPKMEGDLLNKFDLLFSKMLKLLIDPIYDGAIGETDFREAFERVITTKGEELATKLEVLLLNQELKFEDIRDVWTEAVRGVAQEFNKEAGK